MVDVRLSAVGWDLFSVDQPRRVLAAHGVRDHVLRLHGADRLEHLDLFVADTVARDRTRRLHGDEREDGEDVVLDHVAEHARAVVVSAAQFHTEFLRHGDLHVVNIPAVPDRLENRIREPEDHDVLNGLLAEVVVDAVDLRFREVLAEVFVECPRAREVAAERLFDDDPPPGLGSLLGEAGRAELVHDLREQRRRDRQIKQHVARELPGRLRLRDFCLQLLEGFDVVEIPLEIVAAFAEIVPLGILDRAGGKLLDVRGGFCAVALVVAPGHRHADHGKILREKAKDLEVVKRGEELPFCQVSRRAEDDNRAGIPGAVVAGEWLVRHRVAARLSRVGCSGNRTGEGNQFPFTLAGFPFTLAVLFWLVSAMRSSMIRSVSLRMGSGSADFGPSFFSASASSGSSE